MATAMKRILTCGKLLLRQLNKTLHVNNVSGCRHLLSESYACTEAWQRRLESPAFQHVHDFTDFIMGIQDQFDKTGNASPLDIDIVANILTEMDEGQIEFVETLFHRFRRCANARGILESTPYAVVRGYIEIGETERLVDLLHDKHSYGIFPNYYVANILMDHCIKKHSYGDAAHVAYEMMVQEDFSHPLTRLLSLYSCVKHLPGFPNRGQESSIEPATDEQEEDWIPVKYIRTPYYDDHFDIRDEQFLLGKTLAMLGRTQDDLIGRSCQLIGQGLYEKFDKGLKLMDRLSSGSPSSTIVKDSLVKFQEALETAPIRDPNTPQVELGFRSVADEIELVKCTPEEKESYLSQFQVLSEKLSSSGRVSDDSLEDLVESYVTGEVDKHEQPDIDAQLSAFEKWTKEREELLEMQVKEYLRQQKITETTVKLKKLQDKEEVLHFFERKEEVALARWRAPKEKPEIASNADLDPDETSSKRRRRGKV